MARRPSPVLAMGSGYRHSLLNHLVMMAKRPDLLDETGGLHPESQLSDPFIPDTATIKPSARPQTPTTGFKPLPTKGSVAAPALAATAPKSQHGTPDLITRDAHTVPVHMHTPELIKPTLDA
jgi:hypothetical protein